jgi:trehalose 6-phosphate phosphatase
VKALFSPEGEAALAAALTGKPLLVFDFDGTLAPIVARPADARVPPAIAWRLDQLARRVPVAILSGRDVADVRPKLGFEPSFIIGNHGAEDPLAPAVDLAAPLEAARVRLNDHALELEAAGVAIETKRYSIALHYRLAEDHSRALRVIARLVGEIQGVEVFGGKLVVNLVASRAPDKALAVARLVQRCDARSAVFLGDDVNDESVFAHGAGTWLTIRVGHADMASRAMFSIDSVEQMPLLLDHMLTMLGPRPVALAQPDQNDDGEQRDQDRA